MLATTKLNMNGIPIPATTLNKQSVYTMIDLQWIGLKNQDNKCPSDGTYCMKDNT